MHNLLILAGSALIAIGVLTPNKNGGMVESPNANGVPNPDEIESQTDSNDDSDQSGGGDVV